MSNWKKFTGSLIIRGKHFNSSQLAELAESAKNTPENGVYEFILEWNADINFIFQKTSGTTGSPKLIKIHKDVLVFSALNTGSFLDLKRYDKALLCLPVEFIAGKMMIVRAFVLGLDLDFQLPKGTIKINEEIDFCALTPLQLQNCVANNSLSKIRKVIVGGSPVSKNLKENIQLFSSKVYETYGMTETASHIALRKLNGPDKSDLFRVMAGVSVTTNTDSQLIISSNGLKLKNLVTNDIVHLLDTDSFEWLGRKDNVINSGGIKLFPELIESKLKQEIENDFFVFGISSEKFGQSPAIVIEGSTGVDLSDVFYRNLTKYEIPKKIFYVDNFIRTESGKINRNETIAAILLLQ